MAKQQTKKQRLNDLFCRAQKDLSRSMFTDWLEYCYGVFESTARFNRVISRYDITLIAMELGRLKKRKV